MFDHFKILMNHAARIRRDRVSESGCAKSLARWAADEQKCLFAPYFRCAHYIVGPCRFYVGKESRMIIEARPGCGEGSPTLWVIFDPRAYVECTGARTLDPHINAPST